MLDSSDNKYMAYMQRDGDSTQTAAAPEDRPGAMLPFADKLADRRWLGILRAADYLLLAGGLAGAVLLPEGYQAERLAALLLLAAAGAALVLLRRDAVRPAVFVLAWGLWLALATLAEANGGLRSPALIGFPVLVTMMGLMLGPMPAFSAAAATAALPALFSLAERDGLMPSAGPASRLSLWLCLILALALGAVLAYFVTRRFAERYRESQRLGRELAARIDEVSARVSEKRRSEEKFARVFHASPVAILISRLDDGRHLDVNGAFRQQFGWSRFEALGATALDLGLWPDAAAHAGWLETLRRTGKIRDYPAVLRTRSGEPRQVLAAAEILELGEAKCVITLIHDITALHQAVAEIRVLNAALEERVRQRTAELTEANKELESFAYSVSHDLRAPLRGIDGYAHLLFTEYAERVDDQGREYLARIRHAAQRMGTLIDDLLDLSRVSRHEMRREEVDLSRMAAEAIEDLKKSGSPRNAEIHVEAGCTAHGDPMLLRLVLENLLGNAWKYTGRNATTVIRFGNRRNVAGEAAFYVSDNGVGFDMAYVDKLFLPFHRLHKIEDFAGSGVGLASVARVVRRHRGRVWAESAPGRGATFYFTLSPQA